MELFLSVITEIIAAIGVIGASVAGNKINAKTQEDVNNQNLAYAQDMTEQQWQRDDSSLQRQVEDAKLAGLSPLAVTGSLNSSSPLNYTAQAPQMDLSSLVGAFSSFDNITNVLENRYKEKKEDERLDKQLSASINELEKTIKANEQLQKSQFAQDALVLGKQLTYEYTVLTEQSKAHKQDLESDRLIELSRQNQELYSQVCASIGMSPQIEYVSASNLSEYTEKMSAFMKFYNQWAKDSSHFSDDYNITSRSTSDSAGLGSSVAGVAGVNFSDGSSESATYDYSDARMRKLYEQYLKNAIFPVLIDSTEWSEREYKYTE